MVDADAKPRLPTSDNVGLIDMSCERDKIIWSTIENRPNFKYRALQFSMAIAANAEA